MKNVNPEHVLTIVSPDTREELTELLELRWPDRRIPAAEFHELISDIPGINIRIWISHVGCGRHWYNTHEVAELLWGWVSESDSDADE